MIETLTVFTREADLAEATPLAVALGMAAGFAPEAWTGAFRGRAVAPDGTIWRALSLSADLSPVRAALASGLPPELDAARAKLVTWQFPADPEVEAPPVPTVTTHPEAIIALIGPSGLQAQDMVGLVPVVEGDA
jgi:hypothetical protein